MSDRSSAGFRCVLDGFICHRAFSARFGAIEMGIDDRYRLSAHAVITDEAGRVLLLQATYGDRRWGLPGGAVDPGEALHETIVRECKEELSCEVQVKYLSGIYYHSHVEAHVAIYRCSLPIGAEIRLSSEHSQFRYAAMSELADVQRKRVEDCLNFSGVVITHRF
jgi:8-oxo-dGTP diphosphatase